MNHSRAQRLDKVYENLLAWHPNWVGHLPTLPSLGGMRKHDLDRLVADGRAERGKLPWLYRAKISMVDDIMDEKRKAYWESRK